MIKHKPEKREVAVGELVHAEDCFACRRSLNDFYRKLDLLTEKARNDPHIRARVASLQPSESVGLHTSTCNRCFDHERGLIRKYNARWDRRPEDGT